MKSYNRFKRYSSFLALCLAATLVTGCASGRYTQQAGLTVDSAETGTNLVTVVYKFNAESGNLDSIAVTTANFNELALLDQSRLTAVSAISKSEVARIAGNREGMLNNKNELSAEGIATEQQLDDAFSKLSDLIKNIKSPVPLP